MVLFKSVENWKCADFVLFSLAGVPAEQLAPWSKVPQAFYVFGQKQSLFLSLSHTNLRWLYLLSMQQRRSIGGIDPNGFWLGCVHNAWFRRRDRRDVWQKNTLSCYYQIVRQAIGRFNGRGIGAPLPG